MFSSVFVYGTLKTNQCRAKCWPIAPISIERAWTYGSLYDIGPYPALIPGQDRVLGEVWHFSANEIDEVFATLDRIEGTNQPGATNEYDRVTVVVHTPEGRQHSASTYIYARRGLLRGIDPQRPSYRQGDYHYVVWPHDACPADRPS